MYFQGQLDQYPHQEGKSLVELIQMQKPDQYSKQVLVITYKTNMPKGSTDGST
jgi:hypothetical protein